MKSPAAERGRPTLWDGLVAILVLAVAVLLLFFLRPEVGNFLTATVVLDGVELAQYQLNELTEPVTLPVDAPWPLVVEVEPGRIRVESSTCGSQDCVHTGWVHRSGQQIVCLPNRLIISVTGSDEPPIDAVSG